MASGTLRACPELLGSSRAARCEAAKNRPFFDSPTRRRARRGSTRRRCCGTFTRPTGQARVNFSSLRVGRRRRDGSKVPRRLVGDRSIRVLRAGRAVPRGQRCYTIDDGPLRWASHALGLVGAARARGRRFSELVRRAVVAQACGQKSGDFCCLSSTCLDPYVAMASVLLRRPIAEILVQMWLREAAADRDRIALVRGHRYVELY